jgi:hypothetical protein
MDENVPDAISEHLARTRNNRYPFGGFVEEDEDENENEDGDGDGDGEDYEDPNADLYSAA